MADDQDVILLFLWVVATEAEWVCPVCAAGTEWVPPRLNLLSAATKSALRPLSLGEPITMNASL